ncbi:hypothetical protein [Chitinimonas lacunae]|uniref:Uncharacterized protein n=1 Tax=Chitinimonas lacunae TaxID=1963018 RepID=A0ABV8MIU7_9NEIS
MVSTFLFRVSGHQGAGNGLMGEVRCDWVGLDARVKKNGQAWRESGAEMEMFIFMEIPL